MQAVILVGGLGARVRPMTYRIPKAMIEINHKPFLFYLLNLLKNKGFTKILLLIGYLGSYIENYFKKGDRLGLSITYSFEDIPLGTGGALKNAQDLIDSEFLLVYGDTYLDFDYGHFIKTFYEIQKKGLMCVFANKERKLRDNVLMDQNNRIIAYNKNNPSGLFGVDAGIFVFKKEILGLIPEGANVSFENCVYQNLIDQHEFFGYSTDTLFLDIGSFQMLNKAKEFLR